jgi:predicted hydrocarbon binding protein
VDTIAKTRINAIVPLALLEAIRSLDRPSSVVLEGLPQDFVPKRLGASATVAGQIERYAHLVDRGSGVVADEVIQLLRLVARRNDAGLLLYDAGRRAARHGVRRSSAATRLLHRFLPAGLRRRVGFTMTRAILRRVFALAATRNEEGVVTATGTPPTVDATPDGTACALYGALVTELLRAFTDFDGLVAHSACRGRGDAVCRWETGGEEAD